MRKAFTAIELMIVVAVLMLLLGILVPVVSGLREKAKVKLARSRIGAIALALDQYRLVSGVYPPGTDVDPCTLYKTLTSGEGFMEFSKEELKPSGGSYEVVDPWGNPWVYREYHSKFSKKLTKVQYDQLYNAEKPHNPMSFDLFSYGPDGKQDDGNDGEDNDSPPDGKVDETDELEDDITNW